MEKYDLLVNNSNEIKYSADQNIKKTIIYIPKSPDDNMSAVKPEINANTKASVGLFINIKNTIIEAKKNIAIPGEN